MYPAQLMRRCDDQALIPGSWKGKPQHEARTHWKVQTVPTILRLEEVGCNMHSM